MRPRLRAWTGRPRPNEGIAPLMDFALEEMIQQQLVSRGIRDDRVFAAFRTVSRKDFVPPYLHNRAYEDERLPIGMGQTLSPPYLVARMLQELKLPAGARVLEIGTGAGYQTALVSTMAEHVFTVEILPELSARARKMLMDDMEITNVSFRSADGYQGWSDQAPFDAVVVSAAAEEIPWPLQGQLRSPGRLVMPVGDPREQTLQAWERKRSGGELSLVFEEPVNSIFGAMAGEAEE